MYDEVSKKIEAAKDLPQKTRALENDVGKLEGEAPYGTDFGLPVSDTQKLHINIENELVTLERRMEGLIALLPKHQEELQQLQHEISVNEESKEGLEKFASDAVRKREGARAAGKADRENTGQWSVILPPACNKIYSHALIGTSRHMKRYLRSWRNK